VQSYIISRYQQKYQFFLDFFYFLKFIIFFYIAYSSFIFSSNYEQLLFRNVDDNAMITSITYMQEALVKFDWSSFFYKYDYAYGWLFWIIYAVFSFPAFALTQLYPSVQEFEAFHIVSIRFFSLLLIFLTVYLVKRVVFMILGKDNRKNLFIAEVLSFSVLLFPSVGYWAGRVQPSALTALLFVLTIALMLSHRYEAEPKKINFLGMTFSRIDCSVIVFGALIGTKPTTIPLAPIILTIYALVRHEKIRNEIRKENMLLVRHAVIGSLAALLSASPSVIIMPVKTLSNIFKAIKFFSNSSANQEIEINTIFSKFYNGFILEGIGAIAASILLLLLISLFLRSDLATQGSLRIFLIFVSSVPAVLFFCSGITENVGLISVYLFPLIVAQAFLFPALITQWATKNNALPLFLTMIFLIASAINFNQNLATSTNSRLAINSYVLDAKSVEKLNLISAQEKFELAIGSRRPLTILQSYRSPTILSDIRKDVQTFYSFDNWGEFMEIDKVDYIILNDLDIALLPRGKQLYQLDIQRDRTSELLQGIDVITRLVKLNKFSEQRCEKVSYHLGNTLFMCR
jgi:hypothetical protein